MFRKSRPDEIENLKKYWIKRQSYQKYLTIKLDRDLDIFNLTDQDPLGKIFSKYTFNLNLWLEKIIVRMVASFDPKFISEFDKKACPHFLGREYGHIFRQTAVLDIPDCLKNIESHQFPDSVEKIILDYSYRSSAPFKRSFSTTFPEVRFDYKSRLFELTTSIQAATPIKAYFNHILAGSAKLRRRDNGIFSALELEVGYYALNHPQFLSELEAHLPSIFADELLYIANHMLEDKDYIKYPASKKLLHAIKDLVANNNDKEEIYYKINHLAKILKQFKKDIQPSCKVHPAFFKEHYETKVIHFQNLENKILGWARRFALSEEFRLSKTTQKKDYNFVKLV